MGDIVLKSDELFFVDDASGNRGELRAAGLYCRDTRHLSQLRFTLAAQPLSQLGATVHSATYATIVSANCALRLENGNHLLPACIAVEQHLMLGDALRIATTLRNYSGAPITIELGCETAANFMDLFQIRGIVPKQRGLLQQPQFGDNEITLSYRDVTGSDATTIIGFDQHASFSLLQAGERDAADSMIAVLPGFDELTWMPATKPAPSVLATFAVDLEAGGSWELQMTIRPVATEIADSRNFVSAPTLRVPERTVATTDNPAINALLRRSAEDLSALHTCFPDGALPAAGIPWFVAPFGRDSLITGLQTLHESPRRAAGTLRTLAALQGSKIDPWTNEEPGKILHEMRYGEMARSGQIPHSPYYGSIDATPLFAWLFAETYLWTGDDHLFTSLHSAVTRAIEWIEDFGDVDGDGLVEYRSDQYDGVGSRHQVWKDSHDSTNHIDGAAATGNIAAIEVQGYVYAAYDRLARVMQLRGDHVAADALGTRAAGLRSKVEEQFWMEDSSTYAQGLDGSKIPIRAITSNPGHLLFTGLPCTERAGRVIERLFQPDMNTGWGIRTLSAEMPTYNPMSYHNGSIWPHDNSLIAAGCHRYGHHGRANEIFGAIADLGSRSATSRLAELYCGFPRTGIAASVPIDYPVSCSPQAWAAAAPALLLLTAAGLRPDLESGVLCLNPHLPEWINEVTFRDMNVLGGISDIAIRRQNGSYVASSSNIPVQLETC